MIMIVQLLQIELNKIVSFIQVNVMVMVEKIVKLAIMQSIRLMKICQYELKLIFAMEVQLTLA